MSKQKLTDPMLDRLLNAYAVKVDMSENAVQQTVGAARRRAVLLQEERKFGWFAQMSQAFGWRAGKTLWSGVSALVAVMVIGVSLGATNAIPEFDDHAIAVDFDSIMGTGAVAIAEDISS